jgi:hypothetical protein
MNGDRRPAEAIRRTREAIGTPMSSDHPKTASRESTDESTDDVLVCRKTDERMTWERAYCPNQGQICAYRAECQICVVIAERKDDET